MGFENEELKKNVVDFFASDNKEHWLDGILENFWIMLMYRQRWKVTGTFIFPQERLAFTKSMAIGSGK